MMRKIKAVAIICFICLLFLFSCSSQQKEKTGMSQTLDTYFSQQFPPKEPGGAVLIMKDDSILFSKGYGVADMTTLDPVTPNTLFNLGSISKTFVANAVLILGARGKLTVEDSLIRYFPGFKNKDIGRKVKIRHLLTHTSGLPDNREVWKDTVFYLVAKDAENWAPVLKADKLNFEPGSRFEYSNPAFNALALIVEQVSEMKWQDFIKQNIMQPSGMLTSTITDGPHPEKGVAHGYVKNKGEWTEDDYGEEPTFPASGNGGVWSSVEELARYELAIKKSVFLNPEIIADSRTVKTFKNWSDTISPFIGWSWFIDQTGNHLQRVGHAGDQGGFLCNYVTIPQKQILIVILCNTPRDVPGFTNFVYQTLQEQHYLDD